MLNISNQYKASSEKLQTYKTVRYLENRPHYKLLNRIVVGLAILGVLVLFLPWTQNISGSGFVTTLKPDQRPQTIHSAIAGRIEKWYVQEGDFVKKGDTIVFLSEIKDSYFDPNLVENTRQQVEAKKSALQSYGGKVTALEAQVVSLARERELKLQQAANKIRQAILKVRSDSIDLEAVRTQLKIANTQFDRVTQLNKEGLKALPDVEEKRLKLQESQAKIITQENKLLSSRNDLINARVEINRIQAEYAEKISKSTSDKFTALSSQYDASAEVNKLKNQYANYSIRNGLYYITAPQNGYVNRALQGGLGETIKEGTPVVSIMPSNYQIAVETYVDPIDLPLIDNGAPVRLWFDGWPTIVFSGWPGLSYGTFGGRVVAIEKYISPNGKYRVLIAPDKDDQPWPKQLSIGAGAQTIAMLDTVPVWFELWRTLNGFPANYYKGADKKEEKKEAGK
ncbi:MULTISPECIES: HlyD family secretion protein [unclassified Flavobacterium]|uniref:HlyD family secretion protein n=1 Tax=unclassified Flavobacterium TaxID=196869 RepID=UPI001F13DDA4|nr:MULTISPECIES: HlyD family efflux transporter periplasmic adaptor subunit [unclassified Flavobacterium]UMY65655.1 HlyD family secretion protein [Flavobacterium sp. HJ-32-4]